MKSEIHPKYVETTISCACGTVYHTRSTVSSISVGICAACHPFFTGEQRIVDTAGQVDRFMRRLQRAEERAAQAAVQQAAEEAGRKAGMKPRARIRAAAVIGSEPTIMLTGPTPACLKALQKAGLKASDIDLWEINEAFAVVPMQTARNLGVSLDRVNVNGGSIAMGHPLGATGAIILGTLLDELERQDKTLGLATLCVGGGMGIATIIERI